MQKYRMNNIQSNHAYLYLMHVRCMRLYQDTGEPILYFPGGKFGKVWFFGQNTSCKPRKYIV